MTQEQARLVRVLRTQMGCTWRRIAEIWEEVYETPPRRDIQAFGAELCHEAGQVLGIDLDKVAVLDDWLPTHGN